MPRPSNGRNKPAQILVTLAFFLFLAANYAVQQYYVDRSRAQREARSAAFTEVPNGSAGHILSRLAEIKNSLKAGDIVVTDTWSVVLAKIESMYATGHVFYYPADDFFVKLTEYVPQSKLEAALRSDRLERAASVLLAARRQNHLVESFPFRRSGGPAADHFVVDKHYERIDLRKNSVVLLRSGPDQTILNRWYSTSLLSRLEVLSSPLNDVHNFLIFVASEYGLTYMARSNRSTLFQLEPDRFFYGSTMSGWGRYGLFQVINASPDARLEIWMTDTVRADGRDEIPPAVVYGRSMVRFPTIGRGSGRIASPPVSPMKIGNGYYYLLDMGVEPRGFPEPRAGLMRLYGAGVVFNPRKLTTFVRDISVIPDKSLQALRAPHAVTEFPKDLQNRALFYSGIYEDGWCSEEAALRLARSPAETHFRIKGLVPLVHDPRFSTLMAITVDGKAMTHFLLPVGYFNKLVALPPRKLSRPQNIRFTFSNWQRLPNGDDRPVSAKIDYMGYTK